MVEYSIQPERYRYIEGDVHGVLGELAPGSFDTVFCFGFLYHTIHHMAVLSAVARIGPQSLIVDTRVVADPQPMVELKDEDSGHEANAVDSEPSIPGRALVGVPSRAGLEMMLRHAGFGRVQYFDWHRQGIADWSQLEDYRDDGRVSLLTTRTQ
jgi:hypothetical protein